MSLVYIDTSAALKVLLEEDSSEQVRRVFQDVAAAKTHLVSSRLLRTEMLRIAHRESLPADEVFDVVAHIHLVDVTRALLDEAGELRLHCRTLDAIHLATATELNEGEEEVRLLTADTAMRRAGADLGLQPQEL